MSTYQRAFVLLWVTIAVAVAGIIHYRVGVAELYPMVRNGPAGPFTPLVGQLETIVPVTLLIIEVGTIAWVVVGGVQKERSTMPGRR